MEELIAKSKAGKAARQMQKEEDLTATDVLDASFQSLLQAGGLTALLKEKGTRHDRSAAQKGPPQDAGDAEFDRVRRELAFESRAKVRLPCFLPWETSYLLAHACDWSRTSRVRALCNSSGSLLSFFHGGSRL